MNKSCSSCKEDISLDMFYKNKANKDGREGICKLCKKEYNRRYKRENKESIKITAKKYIENNKELINSIKMKYYNNNKDKQREYYQKNKEMIQLRRVDYNTAHKKENRAYYNYKEAIRRATKKNSTPEWAELEKIEVLYEKAKWLESLTGMRYDVDHVIPLQNDKVCGLHVWSNLQILEKGINCMKSNKFNGGVL